MGRAKRDITMTYMIWWGGRMTKYNMIQWVGEAMNYLIEVVGEMKEAGQRSTRRGPGCRWRGTWRSPGRSR